MALSFAERVESIIAAFDGGVVIVERGAYEDRDFTLYARDPLCQINMGRPRSMTCAEHMGYVE